jgi:spore germination protein KA
MAGLFENLTSLLIYRGPKKEGFELLEDQSEPTSFTQEQDLDGAPAEEGSRELRRSREKKSPLPISKPKDAAREKNGAKQAAGKTVSTDLRANLAKVGEEFNLDRNKDVVVREFKVAKTHDAFILYIDGMVNKDIIGNLILRQLMTPEHFAGAKVKDLLDYITDNVISVNHIIRFDYFEDIFQMVLNGFTAVFIHGYDAALLVETVGFEKRNVEKPVAENVIRGSQEGFTENLATNIALVRRIIRNKNLTTEILPVDKTGHTQCAMMYVTGLTNPALIREVKRRLKSLNIDFIASSGVLEELIADDPCTIFLQISTTERPDMAAWQLMKGKVVIIVDGTPYAAAVPSSFYEGLISPEDINLKWPYGIFLRVIRYIALMLSIFLPGLYIALTLYHQEMIPPELLNSIVASREQVPFPTFFEIVLMEISFELIREAGIRVPGIIGNTLGIIGALILGQAAVAADLVSPILIIIVALGGLGNFAIPSFSIAFSARIQRFAFILLGGIAGFYGIAAGIFVLGCKACSTKSFGVPQFVPAAPATRKDMDIIFVRPDFENKTRPDFVNALDKTSQGKLTRGWIKKRGGNGDAQGR